MSGEEWEVIKAIASGATTTGVLVALVVALARGLIVTKGHLDAVVAEKDARIAQAQVRADTLHAEKEALLTQIRELARDAYRFTDALSDLRETVKELTKR